MPRQRGGAWNNNPDNLRASLRNRNNPDNRNNNIGFRVVCVPHRAGLPMADLLRRLRFARCGGGQPRWRGCVLPAQQFMLSGVSRAGSVRGLARFYCALGLLEPGSEQAADLGYYAADVFILAVIQPVPVMGQAQIQSQSIQAGIRLL